MALSLLAGCAKGDPVPPPSSPVTTAGPSPTTTSAAPETTTPAASVPTNLRVGTSFTNPGIGLRQGEADTGVDADVARYLAQQLGAQRVTFVEAVPEQRDTLLETDQVDLVVASYSMSKQRSERVTFAGPYLRTGQALLVRRRSEVRTPQDLDGGPVCSAAGTASTVELVRDYPGLHVVERGTVAGCVDLLDEGEVDAVTSDAAILAGFADTANATKDADASSSSSSSSSSASSTSSTSAPSSAGTPSSSPTRRKPRQSDLIVTDGLFTKENWGVAMRRDDLAMCRAVSTALEEMVSSGEWERIVEVNLDGPEAAKAYRHTPPTVRECPEPEDLTTSSTTRPSGSSSLAPSSS